MRHTLQEYIYSFNFYNFMMQSATKCTQSKRWFLNHSLFCSFVGNIFRTHFFRTSAGHEFFNFEEVHIFSKSPEWSYFPLKILRLLDRFESQRIWKLLHTKNCGKHRYIGIKMLWYENNVIMFHDVQNVWWLQ